MSNIEANNSDSIGLKSLVAIANVLDIGLGYFLLESVNNSKDFANQEITKLLNDMTMKQRLFAIDAIKMISDNADKFK